MGMAASQARLLSITSRMSDNELRAQLINNAKMRLTDDTSKASEKYVNALNQVQLMMSNKDTLGNNMYQQLTFNNLTAYSSYNNQYGMINKSGELVVSELDAAKYEQALREAEKNSETDALTEFLKQYGLEKDTTSYWESNKLSDDLKTRYEGDVEYNDNGERISGLHYGYELSKTSTEVMVYETLLDAYTKADQEYTAAVITAMKDYLYSYTPSGFSQTYEKKYDEVLKYNTDSGKNPPTRLEAQQSLDYLEKMFNDLLNNGKINSTNGDGSETEFIATMKKLFDETDLTAAEDDIKAASTVKDVYKYFQQNILSNMDRDEFKNLAPTEKKAFDDAAKELSMFIFGVDVGAGDYDKLDDMEWILNSGKETTNLDGDVKITLEQNIGGTYQDVEYKANFEAIKDIYLIEQMIEEYGAPKYTWIDKNNPNENADAKAQWYTNIFNKMNEDGYQKIEKALTESAEWIQYAFESGLLSLVQVDDEQQWIPTMYSSCSDITEDTIDLEITRAEAEYKRETQKIQAKDQRYDLELKNIDTEHESLQTEYDSIKSVIDKNVERSFKIFS